MRGARSVRGVRTARCAPRAIAAALIAVLPLAGCAGNGGSASDTADDRGSFEATPLPEKLGAGRTVVQSRTRIAPGQVGLEVLTWQISVDTEQFNQAIVTYGAPAVATADEVSLTANGLILRAVNAKMLDSLRDALGGSEGRLAPRDPGARDCGVRPGRAVDARRWRKRTGRAVAQ